MLIAMGFWSATFAIILVVFAISVAVMCALVVLIKIERWFTNRRCDCDDMPQCHPVDHTDW